jgi:hypothetical protein
MPARPAVLTGLGATGIGLAAALAVALLALPAVSQAAPDLRALPAIVSAAQFEMQSDGVVWYWCH